MVSVILIVQIINVAIRTFSDIHDNFKCYYLKKYIILIQILEVKLKKYHKITSVKDIFGSVCCLLCVFIKYSVV